MAYIKIDGQDLGKEIEETKERVSELELRNQDFQDGVIHLLLQIKEILTHIHELNVGVASDNQEKAARMLECQLKILKGDM